MNETVFRRAEPEEAEVLTALTRRSKAHWGYPREFLDRLREMLSISPDAIRDGHVVVAERDGAVAGYYQLSGEPPDGELADMFVDPAAIGTGP
ncbi:GNAT family N-acetyltransferase, partial [Saccharopolyspora taberi]